MIPAAPPSAVPPRVGCLFSLVEAFERETRLKQAVRSKVRFFTLCALRSGRWILQLTANWPYNLYNIYAQVWGTVAPPPGSVGEANPEAVAACVDVWTIQPFVEDGVIDDLIARAGPPATTTSATPTSGRK